jgi:hypothetical protein
MTQIARQVREIAGYRRADVPWRDLLTQGEPIILRGLVTDWPIVTAGRASSQAAVDHLLSFYNGRPAAGYTASAREGGRYFYGDETLTRLNFDPERVQLDDYLARLLAALDDPEAPSRYVGSTDLDGYFPGLTAANDLVLDDPMFARVLKSIWIGNRTIASTHYDMSNNIACVVVGARRFTLFPPDQIANLYPGPLEPTPGGQVVSLVDLRAPDLERFPDFARALDVAHVADLEAGDALIYPALWWHNVEALAPFNMMVNYWWNDVPAFMDTPMNTVLHGLLSLRDRPEQEKQAWRAIFDYYLFGPAERTVAHLPEPARGPLAPLDQMAARRLRGQLLNRLNR